MIVSGGSTATLSGCTLGASVSPTVTSVTDGVLTVQSSTLSNELIVSGGSTATLSGRTLGASVSPTVTGDSSLSLASMAVPLAVLGAAEGQLSGAGSSLRLAAVTVPEVPDMGELTGTMTVQADGSKTTDPAFFGLQNPGTFTVSSGPCAVSDGGRCVGRPGGYLGSEACAIIVGGGVGLLGASGVFDTNPRGYGSDYITMPNGSTHTGSDCPEGVLLLSGDSVGWASDRENQGNNGDNDCAAHGLCGLPYSDDGLGGGWQICFA